MSSDCLVYYELDCDEAIEIDMQSFVVILCLSWVQWEATESFEQSRIVS